MMAASRMRRRTARRAARQRKPAAGRRPAPAVKPVRAAATAAVQVLYRFCKAGWAVVVEKSANAQGTRFVCPFCSVSHRVPGPVRGFRKVRRAQWIKFRRVEE